MHKEFGILGAGAWGTALAVALAAKGSALLWARDPGHAAAMAQDRENKARLPGIALPERLEVTADLNAAREAALLLLAVPAQTVAALAQRLEGYAGTVLICAKGIDQTGGRRLGDLAAAILPGAEIGALSGPSFAAEVALGLPTALVLALPDHDKAAALARRLATESLRLYPSDDVIGVEIAAALKNVVAIAAGIVTGLGLGENARAALVTRGLAEMTRLAVASGGRATTMLGLAGLGDLMLTASSPTSRNTRLGMALAAGDSGGTHALSEGAFTAAAALRLGARFKLDLPITAAVAAILSGEITVYEARTRLLARPVAMGE